VLFGELASTGKRTKNAAKLSASYARITQLCSRTGVLKIALKRHKSASINGKK